ncbi:hypothetical protein FF1_027619 [Malus domestica]
MKSANPTAIMLLIAIAATAAAAATPTATQYVNHTVGGATGWFFNSTSNSSFTNYSSWAATQTFNLGDYLIFNTSTNQTVIETYNQTTYRSCSMDDASDDDTFEYGGGSNAFGDSQVMAVPLTHKGLTYYFSSAGDGVQCQRGMAFEIQVNQGLGLPPVLMQPPPPPYTSPPPGSESAQTPPGTVAETPPKGNGALRNCPNVREGLFGFLALLLLVRL